MTKRPISSSEIECSSESEYELKPDISSMADNDSDPDPPTTKTQVPSSKKSKKSNSSSKEKERKKAEPKRVWTSVEDEIFLEIMGKVVKNGMWEAVKEDGRLGYRGSPGIYAHIQAIMNRLKKGSGV